ncbi:hypothetical protein SAMN05216316_1103 [Nitrosovibrio sp. Nv6]|nr:hypothetical protein SAMN05216316_1103 [Nitrosovibrio sp. Nv6]
MDKHISSYGDVVGIPWCSREDYPKLYALVNNGNELVVSYDQWIADTHNTRNLHEAAGRKVVQINIVPDDFSEWCVAKGCEAERHSLILYIGWQVQIATGIP